MKLRPILLGILAALLGVALQVLYMRRFEQEASGGSKIELLVAVQTIERGKPVTSEMLSTRWVPQAYVDDRAVRAVDREKILNLRAVSNVPASQTLAWTDVIASTDDQRDLSTLVQPGNRAMPIRVQYEDSLQLIRPGDFVDVIGVDADGKEASVLLQRVLVLAAGLDTAVERSTDKKASLRTGLLTLSVSLPEAQLLTLAQAISRLVVLVRNANDPRVVDAPADLSREQLFDSQQRAAVQSNNHRPIRIGPGGPQ
ncbi:MAG TPA: Flp pilus assembly protein CpaB [Polyangiaceae bacterium]|jgi:pilus assembly protein CpaB|nr:Flp pilus assembly protein CpaB [Polyangiaceae bacterium]